MALTQTATCSRLSLSVEERQSKRQQRLKANRCRSEASCKSSEDARPDQTEHMHCISQMFSKHYKHILDIVDTSTLQNGIITSFNRHFRDC